MKDFIETSSDVEQDPQTIALPYKILLYIFSFLAPKDLLNAQLVSRLWKKVASPGAWRVLINQYFPYLLKTRPEDYRDNPRKLFNTVYTTIVKGARFYTGLKEAGEKYLLSSLKGQIDVIEKVPPSELSDEIKRRLYIISAAGGNKNALQKLSDREYEIFYLAATIGNLEVVIDHLSKYKSLDARTKDDALDSAAASGHYQVVMHFLNIPDLAISSTSKHLLPWWSCIYGNLTIVEHILTHYGQQIDAIGNSILPGINAFLPMAASNGYLSIVKCISDKVGIRLFDSTWKKALKLAAENGHLDIVKYILENKDKIVQPIDIGSALCSAAAHNQVFVVDYLLTEKGEIISSTDKGEAFINSAEKGYFSTVQCVLEHARKDISSMDWYYADKYAYENKKAAMVEYLAQEKNKPAEPQQSTIDNNENTLDISNTLIFSLNPPKIVGKREIDELNQVDNRTGVYQVGKYELRKRNKHK